ncbi:MAG TPA: hypothetical protein H9804_00615 [Candidatus Mucispirillum faecigallinarum]|uniref:Uncharacterized protein n=1 Tax=Candidatus Mucispirillum faecigallinarum TaxID=2838699 RepID=A0A9D2GTG0_9BACT|nr:hypothetical protein [Candidatus Mucispirillum faecigallinarum]
MKRICLFAGYDDKNIIHNYVVYYLKELSTVSDIYYMADNEISETEKSKIMPYVKDAYGFNHKKYDFGSWYELIKIIGWEKILEYDELILANDSVFGPLYPMKDFIGKIEKDTEWDVCGIDRVYSLNTNRWYCSSFFIVFKKNTLASGILQNVFNNIPDRITYDYAVKELENPLMESFYKAGYTVKSFCGSYKNIFFSWQEYCSAGVPFIKKKIFTKELFYLCHKNDWITYINQNYDYNINYITDCLKNDEKYIIEFKENKIDKLKKIYRKILRINIRKDKFYLKLFGINIVKINKKHFTYILFGKQMKSKMNIIPIKIINQ